MSEIKTIENFRTQFIKIAYKIWKLKDVYEKVLKEVTCNFRKLLNKKVKSIKKVLQEVESVWKSPPAKNPHHAETSRSTHNAN